MADWNKNIIDEFHAKGGKGIGHFGDNLLLLTTTGARTGERRTNPVAFHRQGDRYVIAATNVGAPSHPAWYHNLVKDPNVTIQGGTEKFPARATIDKGAERDPHSETHARAMPQPGFREYPNRKKRVIQVIV